jgi:hypothetical protein
MAESYTQVPPDSTGRKIHTRQRTIGANTVEDQFVIQTSARTRTGLYRCNTGAHVVLAAAHAATAGFWWLINPVGSAVAVAVKRITFMSQIGSALATPTSPRMSLERVTFTGTASGASVTPAKRVRTTVAGLAADATNVASLRTASTGLTLAAGESVRAFLPAAAATGVGAVAASEDDWEAEFEDEEVVLAAGEGVVFRQADAGTTADTRRVITNVTWEEFTAP